MTKLTTERLDKLQDNLLQFQDAYSDPADKENYDIFVDALHILDEFKAAKEKLIAYEQAAEHPAARITWDGSEFSVSNVSEDFLYGGTAVYLAPVLPKQPELIGMKVSIDTVADNIGHRLFGEIVGTSDSNGVPVLCIEVTENNDDMAAPAQPVIPEGLIKAINRLLDNDGSRGCFDALEQHRAKTELERLLATAQQNEAQNIPENIPAPLDAQDLELYVDMLENSDSDDEDGELNNTQLIVWLKELQRRRALSAQPVSEPYKLPQGYALVPCKLTAENGAKSCMIGKFIEQTEISCPECSGDDECETCDGSGTIEVTAHVSWKTIKDIWAKGIEHFAAAPAQDSE